MLQLDLGATGLPLRGGGADPGLRLAFASGRYCANGVIHAAPATVPGLAFARSGDANAQRLDGGWTAFADGQARITDRGLLIEEARTNQSLQSVALDSAAVWLQSGCSVIANAAPGLLGMMTADALIEDASNASHFLRQPATKAAGQSYVFSLFMKPAGRTRASLFFSSSFNVGGINAVFVLEGAGSASATGHASARATISAMPDGWYRCSLIGVSAPDTTGFNQYILPVSAAGASSYAGDGASGVLVWGAQLEVGGFASSPVLTAASAVTRPTDVMTASHLVAAGADVCERGEAELLGDNGAAQTLLDIHDGSDANRVVVQRDAGGKLAASVVVGGAATLIGEVAKGGPRTVKWALSRAGSTWTFVADGVTAGAQTVGGMPDLTARRIGARRTGAEALNAYVRDLHSLPWALSAGQMQALTA